MKRQGFSRWELVALGAVFCAGGALLPVVAQGGKKNWALEGARAASCRSNLKQVATGMLMYQQDYDERLPKVALAKKGAATRRGFDSYGWAEALQPYLKTVELLQCPAEPRAAQKDSMKPGYTDYWLNSNVSGVLYTAAKSPEKLITMGDGDGGASVSNARYNLNKLPKNWISKTDSPARRHFDQGCYAFLDGHAKRLTPSQVGGKTATFALK